MRLTFTWTPSAGTYSRDNFRQVTRLPSGRLYSGTRRLADVSLYRRWHLELRPRFSE